jgi:hypothetical protein
MKKQFCLILLSFALLHTTGLYAQTSFNWGSDEKLAKENWALLQDAVTLKIFDDGIAPLEWFLNNLPNAHPNVYRKGIEVYSALAENTQDAAKAAQYQDKAIALSDQMVEQFPDEKAEALNRKGIKMAQFWANRPEKFEEAFKSYEEIIALNANKTYSTNVIMYFYILCTIKASAADEITDEKALQVFEVLSSIVEANLETTPDDKYWLAAKDQINQIAEQCITIDCDFVKTQQLPKYRQNPDDLELLKKILRNMTKGRCFSDPLFVEICRTLAQKEPSYNHYQILATAYKANSDKENYLKSIEKSAEYANTNQEKASIYLELASAGINMKGNALKAASLDPSTAGKAYTLIGNLYMNSGSACSTDNPVTSKAVYIAAYNMYLKAGNNEAAARAQQYFPSKEDIFIHDMAGKSVSLPCIGETVTIPSL